MRTPIAALSLMFAAPLLGGELPNPPEAVFAAHETTLAASEARVLVAGFDDVSPVVPSDLPPIFRPDPPPLATGDFDGDGIDEIAVFHPNSFPYGFRSGPRLFVEAGPLFYNSGGLRRIADDAALVRVGVSVPAGTIRGKPVHVKTAYRFTDVNILSGAQFNGPMANGNVRDVIGNGFDVGGEIVVARNGSHGRVWETGVEGRCTFDWFDAEIVNTTTFNPAAPTIPVAVGQNPASTEFVSGYEVGLFGRLRLRNGVRAGVGAGYGKSWNNVVGGTALNDTEVFYLMGTIQVPLSLPRQVNTSRTSGFGQTTVFGGLLR